MAQWMNPSSDPQGSLVGIRTASTLALMGCVLFLSEGCLRVWGAESSVQCWSLVGLPVLTEQGAAGTIAVVWPVEDTVAIQPAIPGTASPGLRKEVRLICLVELEATGRFVWTDITKLTVDQKRRAKMQQQCPPLGGQGEMPPQIKPKVHESTEPAPK